MKRIKYLLIRAHARKAQAAISRHPEMASEIVDALFDQRQIKNVYKPFPIRIK